MEAKKFPLALIVVYIKQTPLEQWLVTNPMAKLYFLQQINAYSQHPLTAHAQGKTAELEIKVPIGGRGNYVIEDQDGGGTKVADGRRQDHRHG